jgi:hypothetical protein
VSEKAHLEIGIGRRTCLALTSLCVGALRGRVRGHPRLTRQNQSLSLSPNLRYRNEAGLFPELKRLDLLYVRDPPTPAIRVIRLLVEAAVGRLVLLDAALESSTLVFHSLFIVVRVVSLYSCV